MPGIAAKPTPARGCASMADVVWAISNPATQPMTAAPNAQAYLRMCALAGNSCRRGITKRGKRRRVDASLFHGPECLAPYGLALGFRPLAEKRHAANGDGRNQHRKRKNGIIGKSLPAGRDQKPSEIGTHDRPEPAEADGKPCARVAHQRRIDPGHD